MLNSILAGINTILLVICVIELIQIKRGTMIDAVSLRYYFNDSINSILRQQNKELARTYAAEQDIANRIEAYLKDGNFNLPDLAGEVGDRAVVYAIEKAEASVKLAEESLLKVRQKISNVQSTLNNALEHNWQDDIERHKNTLKELSRQEDILENRVNEAYAYLKSLTDTILSQTDQPMS